MKTDKPLVYSCSGCSSVAQMTNRMALWLDRAGIAEMSCIAGVGGGVPGLLRTAKSGRAIVALDGCAMQCCKACLDNAELKADVHLTLSDFGALKRKGQDFDAQQARDIFEQQVLPCVLNLKECAV